MKPIKQFNRYQDYVSQFQDSRSDYVALVYDDIGVSNWKVYEVIVLGTRVREVKNNPYIFDDLNDAQKHAEALAAEDSIKARDLREGLKLRGAGEAGGNA